MLEISSKLKRVFFTISFNIDYLRNYFLYSAKLSLLSFYFKLPILMAGSFKTIFHQMLVFEHATFKSKYLKLLYF